MEIKDELLEELLKEYKNPKNGNDNRKMTHRDHRKVTHPG